MSSPLPLPTLDRAPTAETMPTRLRDRADWFGLFCSVGCAIHCAATPVLLSVLPSVATVPSLSVRWLSDPLVHQMVAGFCVLAIARSVWPDWQKHHSPIVGWCALSGLLLLLLAAFVLPDQCCAPGTATWSRSLLTTASLHRLTGEFFAGQILAMQPWLTPLGGGFLIVAHVVNIRIRCCATSACRSGSSVN